MANVDAPEQQAKQSMRDTGMPEWKIDSLAELNSISKAGYVADISSAFEEVTRRKPISFDKFLKDHAAYFTKEI